jgi:hypothetical protein
MVPTATTSPRLALSVSQLVNELRASMTTFWHSEGLDLRAS